MPLKKIRDEVYNDFDTDFATKTTDDLAEGTTNEYSKWTRTGTILKPKTAGDSVDIDGGDLLVGSGTAKVDNLSANKQAMITILDNINFANNLKAQFGSTQQFKMYFDSVNQHFDLTSGRHEFTTNGATPHTPAIGSPMLTITDNLAGISGLSMSNTATTGSGTDFRFIIKDPTGHYFAFSQPGTSNTLTLFGLNRNTTDYIFNTGGTARDIAIGTLNAKDLYFGTNAAKRFRISSGGDLYLSFDNKRFYQGAESDYSQYFDGVNQQFNVVSGLFNFTAPQGMRFTSSTGDYYEISSGANNMRFSKNGPNYINATGASSSLYFGAGGTQNVLGILNDNTRLLLELDNDEVKIKTDMRFNYADGQKLYLGAGSDASIYYDGTNLHIDAQEVGSGTIILDNLPTSDPTVAGAVWNNSGVLNISSG